MKIALLTIWHEYNYGAELQAYATIRALKELGHEVEMIDIRLSDQVRRKGLSKVKALVSELFPISLKFRHFWNKNISTTKRYKSEDELRKSPPKADVYLVGSDQVWNPDITKEYIKLYFLDFGLSSTKRVSYASSFGVEKWGDVRLIPEVKNLLKRFSYTTCRESSGVRILSDTFGIYGRHVVDPTLLFNDYKELIGQTNERKTLAYYPLSKDYQLENLSKRLCEELQLKPVNINQKKNIFKKLTWNKPSIESWIRSIAESKFVITRSFHGLAFCLIYKRQFAMLATRNNRGIRVTELLASLGLSDRYFYSVEELEKKQPWLHIIDYDKVEEKLNPMRTDSWKILKEMLEL